MYDGTDWDVTKWEVVARLDVSAWTILNGGALLKVHWSDDVTLLAICIMEKCDTCAAIRVVLNMCNCRRNTIFIIAKEINNTIGALVTATLMASSDATLVVTSTL